MWGREMRAGLVFVVVSLALGAGVRGWRRAHEIRFTEIVDALAEGDLADRERAASEDAGGTALSPGGQPLSPGDAGASGSAPAARPRAARPAPLRPASIDVDRATAAELVRLPGIGPALASRIVADREARGPFGGPEGLLRVPGIGPKTLAKLRPYLSRAPSPDAPAGN